MRGVQRACDAEVGDLHLTVARDEDVRRLDVAVHHAARVCRRQCERDRDRRVDGAVGTDAALGAEHVGEAAAVDVLHDDVVRASRLAPVVDAHDVGVVEVGRCLGLTPEALDERGVLRELGEQDLRARPDGRAADPGPGRRRPCRHDRPGAAARSAGSGRWRRIATCRASLPTGRKPVGCSQDGLHHGFRDRSGHPATRLLARSFLPEDDDGDRDTGAVGGRETDDPGVGLRRLGAELGGAGLAARRRSRGSASASPYPARRR